MGIPGIRYWIIAACLVQQVHAQDGGLPIQSLQPPVPRWKLAPADSAGRARLSMNRPTWQVGPDNYARNMGFFCQQEWRFEKSVRIPLRVRLGNLEYVDRLEGKRR